MKVRKSNFELLRIVSMLFIVIYHVIVHGKVLENSNNEMISLIMEIIIFAIIVHVNLFVLLTGYFQVQKKFNFKKVWSITNASLFYKIIIMTILAIIGVISLNGVTIIQEISPINVHDYWFIKYYLYLYCISPFLNKLANALTKKEYFRMIVVLFILFAIIPYLTGAKAFDNNGFTLYNFVFLYLIGGYLKLYNVKDSYIFKRATKQLYRFVLLLIFFCCIIINFSMYKMTGQLKLIGSIPNEIFGSIEPMSMLYSNPIVIIQTVSFFLFFETLDFQNKMINYISKLTFGIYLIHDNIFLTKFIYKWLKVDFGPFKSYTFIFNVLLAVIIIFVVCGFIEALRQIIFKFIYNRKISKKVRNKYYKIINNMKLKDEGEMT